MKRQSNKITALYCRIANGGYYPDALELIQNQQMLLTRFASDNGLANPHIYSDCGFSGTTADRPEFQRMLAEIKAGNVESLVVKNLSRLFRGLRLSAIFLEKTLPTYGVTLYTVDDGLYTPTRPFVDLVNALYQQGGQN